MIIKRIIDLIWPPLCHVCDARLPDGPEFVCGPCRAALPRTGYHRDPTGTNPMEHRFAGIIPFERATGHFFYSPGGSLANLIHDFKYRSFPGIARELGHLAGTELYSTGFFSGADMIVPVPLHFIRQSRRGYNQAEMIARGLSQATGIPVSTRLKAFRPHRTQTSLSHEDRRENTRGIFRLRHPEEFTGKTIVVVDDVCTTGSTLLSAAETILSEAPGSRVILFALGVTF